MVGVIREAVSGGVGIRDGCCRPVTASRRLFDLDSNWLRREGERNDELKRIERSKGSDKEREVARDYVSSAHVIYGALLAKVKVTQARVARCRDGTGCNDTKKS